MFEIEVFVCIKMDSALNNLQWLICHKTEPNERKWENLKENTWELKIYNDKRFSVKQTDSVRFMKHPGSR